MTFHLTTFGTCELCDHTDAPINVPSLALVALAYLFKEGRPVSRRELAGTLWDRDYSVASTNLRSMLRRLSAAIPQSDAQLLDIDERYVTLNHAMLTCDLSAIGVEDPSKQLQLLCEGISKGFLHRYGHDQAPIDKWVRAVRLELMKLLRADFVTLNNTPATDALKSDLRHAAILLLEENPQDETVRQSLLVNMANEAYGTAPRINRIVAAPITHPSVFYPDHSSPIGTLPRVALLPPDGVKQARKKGSIATALIEDITIGLCASRVVSMVAPYTAEKIATSDDRATLLKQFDVTYVLDTKRSGNALYVQFIFMPADEIIWAERFDLYPSCTMEQRDLISKSIQSSILEVTKVHAPTLVEFSANSDSYLAYLNGLQSLSKLTLPSVRNARKYFRESLKYQSGFSRALAGISRTLSMEWVLTARGDQELLLDAERAAKLAIDEECGSAEAFKALGMCRLYLGRIDCSLQSLSKAESLSPHYADILCSYADSLIHGGEPTKSLEKIDAAMALNPISPDAYFWSAAGACFLVSDFTQALKHIDQMQDKTPAYRLAAACFGMQGDIKRARAYKNRVLQDNPQFDLQQWLSVVPMKEKWQIQLYKEGLEKAGF